MPNISTLECDVELFDARTEPKEEAWLTLQLLPCTKR